MSNKRYYLVCETATIPQTMFKKYQNPSIIKAKDKLEATREGAKISFKTNIDPDYATADSRLHVAILGEFDTKYDAKKALSSWEDFIPPIYRGFKLISSDFLTTGECKYKDYFDNTVYIRRANNEFVAKLRFNDKDVVAEPINIAIPLQEDTEGGHLNLKYLNGQKDTDDIKAGIIGFTGLMQHFIALMYDVQYVQMPDDALIEITKNNDLTKEDIAEYKMSLLAQYEELKELEPIYRL